MYGAMDSSLQGSLNEKLAKYGVPGASVAVLQDGKLSTAAAGVANLTTGVELTTDTVMHIGSITKVFNATLVMDLVDRGLVDLDDRLTKHLPDLRLKDPEARDRMTVRMLLNHTSGLHGNTLPGGDHDDETIENGVRRIGDIGQLHPPGSEWSYCNAGTVLAGYLAQRLNGHSWYRLIRSKIFEPLQLRYAATLPEEALLYRASVGHRPELGAEGRLVRTSRAFLPLSFAPAGATLMLSAADLVAFARSHMSDGAAPDGGHLLSMESVHEMQRVCVDTKRKGYTFTDGMGLGWMVYDDGLLVHGGGGPGIHSVLYAHPARGFAAAILTNADNSVSIGLVNELMEQWLAEIGSAKPLGMGDVDLPQEPIAVTLDAYTGIYENLVTRFAVSVDEVGLTLSRQVKRALYDQTSLAWTPPERLIPLGNDKFLLGAESRPETRWSNSFRKFAFRNRGEGGRMQYLGNGGYLYRRTTAQ